MILNTDKKEEYVYNPLEQMNSKETYNDFINFCSNYKVFGQDIKVGDDEFMKHLHIKLNEECNANCKFCIEKNCHRKMVDTDIFIEKLKISLDEFERVGLLNSISITGGEPTLNKWKLIRTLELLSKYKINRLTMNTNGYGLLDEDILKVVNESDFKHINISRHHYESLKNEILMRMNEKWNNDILECIINRLNPKIRIRLQCIMTQGTINSISEVKRFISWAKEIGVDNVSIRQLIGCSESYGKDIFDFTNNNIVPITNIIKEIIRDDEFKFQYQTIMDYYIYECWSYKGIDVDLSYADMSLLESTEELETDNNIFREFIFNTDGTLSGSWFRDRKVLLE